VYPRPALDRIEPSVNHLIARRPCRPSLHIPKNGFGPVVDVSPADNVDGPQPAVAGIATGCQSGDWLGCVGRSGPSGGAGVPRRESVIATLAAPLFEFNAAVQGRAHRELGPRSGLPLVRSRYFHRMLWQVPTRRPPQTA
jgi:hypothetical protein